ncbi:MAG: hypothetical protein ACEY3J_03735 [Arsenophonus sp.]
MEFQGLAPIIIRDFYVFIQT